MSGFGVSRLIDGTFAVRTRQLDSVAQLVRALHWNRKAAGSIPARGAIVAFFATSPG